MGASKAKQRRLQQKELNIKEKLSTKEKELLVHYKDGEKPVLINPGDMGITYPSSMIAFKFLVSARFCGAIWSIITDCDETYNFWEPSHFLLFGQGFQTWEYAPVYALRSYAYLLINIVPTWIYSQIFTPNKILLFYFHRCCLSLFCSFCEYYFYRGVCREFGIHIGRLMLMFQLFATGMFIASCAYLPSSFSMYMTLLSIGAWFQRKYELVILTTAISAFLSWPFAALIGLPIAIDMLFVRRRWFAFIKWSIISTIIILLPQVRIDSLYYGRIVVAPLNIVIYNIFTPHGPNIYGTESWTFYAYNLLLNYNIVFPAAVLTPLFLILVKLIIGKSSIRPKAAIPYILALAPLYLWLTVFTVQPHKEERFMYPIYPLISLHGAISIDAVQKVVYKMYSLCHMVTTKPVHYLNDTGSVWVLCLVTSAILGVSRSFLLYHGYSAPINTYIELSRLDTSLENMTSGVEGEINLCLGKEWHRYPSSFFLPNEKWNVSFIESDFKGQLPSRFEPQLNATSLTPPNINDENKEEPSKYVKIDQCHFLVDLDRRGYYSEKEPNYANMTDDWIIVKSIPFLDGQRTPWMYRVLYIPYIFEQNAVLGSYNLLQSKNLPFKQHKSAI